MAMQAVLGTTTPNGDIDIGVKFVYVFGTITLSSNYATGGDTLDFTAMTKPIGCPGIPASEHGSGIPLPTTVSIYGKNGYGLGYVPGTTAANGKVKITTASNTELAAGAYPAGLTGDVIYFQATFPRC